MAPVPLLYIIFLAYPDGRVEEVKLRHCNTSEGVTKILKTFRLVTITAQLLWNVSYLKPVREMYSFRR